MIKVKLIDLINSTETLQKLAQKDFKAKLAWSIARLLKAAEVEIQSFNEARTNLIKKYGEKNEKGELITDEKGNCKILETGVKEFNTELNELVESEVEIQANKIKIEMLEDLDFTPSDMAAVEPFIEMEDEKEE